MRRAVVALALVGCNQAYGLEPTRLDTPPACSTVRFAAPRAFPEFAGGLEEHDPQLSRDGLELWFVLQLPATDAFTLHRAVRAAITDPFGPPEPIDLGLADVRDPSLSADGRHLLVVSAGQVYEALRPDERSTDFLVLVTRGLGTGVDSIDLTWDALRIYYTVDGTLFTARRTTADAAFADVTMLIAEDVDFPSVSPDELEVFYQPYLDQDPDPVYRAGRASVDASFGLPELTAEAVDDADVDPSAEVLVVSDDFDAGISILERACD
jgi:hypothetical protein